LEEAPPEEEVAGERASGDGLEQPIDEEAEQPEAAHEGEEPPEEEEIPAELGSGSLGMPGTRTLQGYEIKTSGSTRKVKAPEARRSNGPAHHSLSEITEEKPRARAVETPSAKRKSTLHARAVAEVEDAGEWMPTRDPFPG
jgi:hypothetical protein